MGCLLYAQAPQARPAQPPAPAAADENKAGAYYNFAMGRLYAELAASEGNKNDYVTKAIQHYKDALKYDPTSGIIFEELTDLYIQTNHLADAVSLAEDVLKQNPDNLDARRMLGRIYTRMIPENQPGRVDEKYVKSAIDQYLKITQKEPKDAESWVMLGRLYRVSNNSPDAEKAFNAALEADPTNEDALTGLASLYADLGDSRRAIEKLKVAAEKAPTERTLGILAEQYEQLNDYKDAAEVLKKLQEVAPDNPKIGRALARDLMYSDQLDEALKLFQQFTADEPRDWESELSIAEIYQAKHDLPKAREAMDKAKKAGPDNLEVRYQDARLLDAEGKKSEALAGLKSMLEDTRRRSYSEAEARARSRILDEYGILARNGGKTEDAVDSFRQLSALGGDYAPRGAVQVIETYRQAKDLATARKEADAAVKKYPDDRMVKMEHAAILADQGKIDDAATEIRGLPKGDHERESLLTLAQLYEKAKRFNEMGKALDDAEKLTASDDDKETIFFMRGAMYERQKKFDASETEFRKVLKINPDNAEALNYLGYMLADRSVRLDEAYQLIKKAIDQDPTNGPFLDSLGWVYYRQGKLEEAEQMLTRALEKIGTDPTVHDHLGDVLAKLGKTREAAAQWQASLKAFQEAPSSDTDPDEMAKVTRKLDEARVKLAKEKK
jgi:tetratricopeptide (TPR) repeat protein